MYRSTFTYSEHKKQKENKMGNKTESRNEKLSRTIAALDEKDYDREVLTDKQIDTFITGRAKQLEYLKRFNFDGTVVLSEFIHVQNNIKKLKEDEAAGFRNQGKNHDEIKRLDDYSKELDARFDEKLRTASRKEKIENEQKIREGALSTTAPLQQELEAVIRKIVSKDIEVQMCINENMITGITARLMNDIVQSSEYRAV